MLPGQKACSVLDGSFSSGVTLQPSLTRRDVLIFATLSHISLNSRQYRHASHYNVTHLRRQSFYSLPNAHIDILDELPFNLSRTFGLVDDAIDHNADIAEAILEAGLASFGIDPQIESWKGQAKPSDMDKARSTIRQLYRDWSAEGEPERRALHYPIISALASYLPATLPSQKQHHQILVPGAGLGRLVLELCSLGYVIQGNEISYHQMLASNYILNCTQRAGTYRDGYSLSPSFKSRCRHCTRHRTADFSIISWRHLLTFCLSCLQASTHSTHGH